MTITSIAVTNNNDGDENGSGDNTVAKLGVIVVGNAAVAD